MQQIEAANAAMTAVASPALVKDFSLSIIRVNPPWGDINSFLLIEGGEALQPRRREAGEERRDDRACQHEQDDVEAQSYRTRLQISEFKGD